ncbi:MAG TPA: class I SAM-dependent methyltransferase [Longimicrobiales bacterium]|nr:class I SAM-dependent methyltransferase [Longimicrobiales bacterium]
MKNDKAASVQSMFGSIAPRYDLLNHLLSLNIDKRWRRAAVDELLRGARADGRFLDGCAGTLDLALELTRRGRFAGRVTAYDFAFPMLERGLPKLATGGGAPEPIDVVCADALRLPLRDRTFDGATIGFGVRNLVDLDAGLREAARVLKPGGRLVVLEFTTPAFKPFRDLYLWYFTKVLPWVGRRISGHDSAYTYLPESVLHFPRPKELAEQMRGAGFRDVGWRSLTGGIAAIHYGTRA